VLDRVAALKATLQATMARKAELEAQAQRTVLQLSRADKLIGGLGGEKLRWQVRPEKK
jgi:dynein heavy chain